MNYLHHTRWPVLYVLRIYVYKWCWKFRFFFCRTELFNLNTKSEPNSNERHNENEYICYYILYLHCTICHRRNLELLVIVLQNDDCNNKSNEGDRHVCLSSRFVVSSAKFGHTTVSLFLPSYKMITENTDLSILFTNYQCWSIQRYNDLILFD